MKMRWDEGFTAVAPAAFIYKMVVLAEILCMQPYIRTIACFCEIHGIVSAAAIDALRMHLACLIPTLTAIGVDAVKSPSCNE